MKRKKSRGNSIYLFDPFKKVNAFARNAIKKHIYIPVGM